jgi:hypothetical protein
MIVVDIGPDCHSPRARKMLGFGHSARRVLEGSCNGAISSRFSAVPWRLGH